MQAEESLSRSKAVGVGRGLERSYTSGCAKYAPKFGASAPVPTMSKWPGWSGWPPWSPS